MRWLFLALLLSSCATLSSREANLEGISYSPYRAGQAPGGKQPSDQEIREDLHLLKENWSLLRLYDSGATSERILRLIQTEALPIRVMLGIWIRAEQSNPGCPWAPFYPESILQSNRLANQQEIQRGIALAQRFPEIVWAVNVGNEALVNWTDHQINPETMLSYVKTVKSRIKVPITVAENYVPWREGLDELVRELDFITLHSYPIWEKKTIDEALSYTQQNYNDVKKRHPGKTIVIGEAGWATTTDGQDIPKASGGEDQQRRYVKEVRAWAAREGIRVFFFEAFDEDWKGAPHPDHPEKHWGFYFIDRRPKALMK